MTAALEGGEWSAARPDRTLPPGKTRYPFYRRLGGHQGWSGRAEESRPHRDSIPNRPARSQSLYRLSYRGHDLCVLPVLYTGTCVKGRSVVTELFMCSTASEALRMYGPPHLTARGHVGRRITVFIFLLLHSDN